MEQQNQQPSQQEQSGFSSSKNFLANPKLPLIAAAVVIILAVGGILLLKGAGLNLVKPTPPAQQVSPSAPTPSPAPSPQPQILEGWQTYRNEEGGFEFDHPNGWTEAGIENLIVFNDKQGRPFMSFTFANRAVIGVSFCGAYPQDVRCELIESSKMNGINFMIDWLPGEEPVAETTINNGTIALFITLNQPKEKELFQKILSTFQFIE